MEYINWLVANYETIITGVLSIIGGFSIIAKLTPTPADDEFLGRIVNFLDIVALNKQR